MSSVSMWQSCANVGRCGAHVCGCQRAAPAAAFLAQCIFSMHVTHRNPQGKVVSTAMNKGVVVAVERLSPHGQYQKRVRITKRYIAHDENAVASVGDYVRLEGCRPLSKSKRFAVAEVIRKAD